MSKNAYFTLLKSQMSLNIVINLQVEWVHCWKDCAMIEVLFLKNLHRHIFHIKCVKAVNHNDRDVEIIKFKRKILQYLFDKYPQRQTCLEFGWMSCEMIAEDLMREFDLEQCEVLEDWENGALLTK